MASTPTTTTIIETNLEPLGRKHCEYILAQLKQALHLSTRLSTNLGKFSRSEYKTASKSGLHPLRDNFDLSVYLFQSLYELLGKKLGASWSAYYRELCVFRGIHAWVMEPKPDMREMRNMIAHNFNAGDFYRGREEDLHPEDDGPTNPLFNAEKYWDLLEGELPKLMIGLHETIMVFEEETPKIGVKKTKEMKEEELWDPTPKEQDVPAEWRAGEEGWVCQGEVVEDIDSSTLWGSQEDGDEEEEEIESIDFSAPWSIQEVKEEEKIVVENIDSSTSWGSQEKDSDAGGWVSQLAQRSVCLQGVVSPLRLQF